MIRWLNVIVSIIFLKFNKAMKKNCLIIVFLFCSFNIYSQNTENTWEHTSHLKLVQIEQGNSYFTTPFDVGNIENLVFEGNLIPNFIIRENDKAHLMLVLTTQLKIRMFNERSKPVRTPSYLPHLSMFYSIGNSEKRERYSVFFRYGHHSNGQQGPTILENGEFNLVSGDFSTNYFELGGVKAFYYKPLKSVLFFESTFEYHMKEFTQNQILGKYSLKRWNNRISILSMPVENDTKGRFEVDARFNWKFGNINQWNALYYKRLDFKLTAYYSPKFLKEVGFFVQYYAGMDYYNIYFDHYLSVLRFGIMTELLRF